MTRPQLDHFFGFLTSDTHTHARVMREIIQCIFVVLMAISLSLRCRSDKLDLVSLDFHSIPHPEF